MQIGICSGPDTAAVARASGADYLEINVQAHLQPLEGEDVWRTQKDSLTALDLPTPAANCFVPGSLPVTGPDVDAHAVLAYGETAFRRAEAIGLDRIVFGSGGARRIPDGFDRAEAEAQFVEILRGLGPLAEKHGVTVVVEPLNTAECNFINSLAEGASLVKRAGHPHIRLLADIYHMGRDGEPPEAFAEHAGLIAHVHIATIPDRRGPQPGDESTPPYLGALKAAGYDGGISFEGGWDDLDTELPRAVDFVRAAWAAS